MNSISGTIQAIEISGSLSLVSVEVPSDLILKTIVIETPETADYLRIGGTIKVLFKETEVIIGTQEAHSISLQNRIPCKIVTIENGRLISKINLISEVGVVVSIISTNAVQQLNLKPDLPVYAMIKLNEMMLAV